MHGRNNLPVPCPTDKPNSKHEILHWKEIARLIGTMPKCCPIVPRVVALAVFAAAAAAAAAAHVVVLVVLLVIRTRTTMTGAPILFLAQQEGIVVLHIFPTSTSPTLGC
jgi:hypothetical protein